jgi:hypothetical protein
MTAFPIDRKRRWNAAPWGRRRLIINGTESDFQIADLIEFTRLKPRISNRQRITRHGVTCPEMVFGVSALPHAKEKFSGLGSGCRIPLGCSPDTYGCADRTIYEMEL